MEKRPLGQSGVTVSVVGLGGIELGPEDGEVPDVDNAASVIRSAMDAGINWLDTSENYLATRNEALIGEALARVDPDFLVATKVAPEGGITGGGTGFRPHEIHDACRASLQRLQRDHVDLYFLHWPTSEDIPLQDTWGAMAELVEQGLVRAIGMSNYNIANIERCNAQRRVDVIQDGLSLIDYLDARAAFRRCGELGIAVTVYEPLASGILSDKTPEQILATWTGPWVESPFFKRLLGPGRLERSFAVADGLRPIARRLDASVAQVALAWVLHQPGVAAAIAGSRSSRHTADNAAATTLDLTPVIDEIEELIPLGPSFA